MKGLFLTFLFFLLGFVLLTTSVESPLRAQSVAEDHENVTFSATCLPASSMEAPRQLLLEINLFDMGTQGQLTSDNGWEAYGRPSISTGKGFAEVQITFNGPKVIRREYCAASVDRAREHTLEAQILKSSAHSSLRFRSPRGTSPALKMKGAGRSLLMVAKPLKEGKSAVEFGDGTPNLYHLTFTRDISISAPPSDEIEAELFID